MITKSGIDSKNFEFRSAGIISEELYMSYTAQVPTGLYTLTNKNGMEVCITNVGARIVSIMVADKFNDFRDVVLGFDSLKGYIDHDQRHSNAHGAVVVASQIELPMQNLKLMEKNINFHKIMERTAYMVDLMDGPFKHLLLLNMPLIS